MLNFIKCFLSIYEMLIIFILHLADGMY
jgi:hypothetical protein